MEIITDIFSGIIDSIRIDLFISYGYNNEKYKSICRKMVRHNFLLHILPLFLVGCINYFFQISLYGLLSYINYILTLISVFLHTVSYIELANVFNTVKRIKKVKNDNEHSTFADIIIINIMMAIYQLIVYFSTSVIGFVMSDKMYVVGLFLMFVNLTIYHSLYSYNNLWQKMDLKLNPRIKVHEVKWPYFLGYGLIATIIYTYTDNAYVLAIYNLYMSALVSIPLLLNFDVNFYFINKPSYSKINLSVFSYMIAQLFYYVKKIHNIFFS